MVKFVFEKIADSDGEERLKVGVRTRRESKGAPLIYVFPGVGDQATTQGSGHGDGRGKKYERQLRGALAWPWG